MKNESSSISYSIKSKEEELNDDEKIDKILKDITLKNPRLPYTLFVLNEIESIKAKDKDQKIVISEMNLIISEKWKNIKEEEKKKYEKLYEEEKYKYKAEIELVRHYLFKDSNNNLKNPAPTAYRIYLNEKLREGFEQGLDPKEVKREASLSWANLPKETKQIYIDKKRVNDNWFMKAKNINKLSPISLFVQEKIEEAKRKRLEPPLLKDISPTWNNLSKDEKKRFEKYAQELNEEKEKLHDLYDIIHGLKPKKPVGAFRIFIQEQIKNNEFKNINNSYDIWNTLKEEEKEIYLMKSYRCQLAYKYKKMIYKKKIKKMLPRKPLTSILFFLKEKKGQKPPNGEIWIKYWRSFYENLSADKKKTYEEKAKIDKENYEKKKLQFKSKIFDMPKKPLSGFLLFFNERIPDLKKEKPNETFQNLTKQIAKEWQKGELVDINFYNNKAEKDRIRFKKQLKEFNKFGYYTRPNDKNNENNNDFWEESKIRKKKRSSIINNKCTKRNGRSTQKKRIAEVEASLSKSIEYKKNELIQIIDK